MKGITLKTFLVAAGSLLAAASLTFSSGAGAETVLELRARLVAQAAATRAATWADAAAQAAAKRIEAAASLAKARCEADNARRRYGMLPGPIVDCTKLAAAGLPPAPPPAPTVSYAWALTTAYTPCSKSCGGGTQLQIVSCQDSSHKNATDSLCTAAKPSGASRSCNTQACAATVDITPPTVPGNPQAKATSCSAIEVTWNASMDTGGSGLKGYDVYRDSIMLTQVMAPLTALSDSGLQPSTSHSYEVAAFDGQGNRSVNKVKAVGPSGAQSVTTPACGGTGGLKRLGSLTGFDYAKDPAIDDATGVAVSAVWGKGIQVVRLDPANGPSLASTLLPGDMATMGIAAGGGVAYAVRLVYSGTTAGVELVALDLRKPAAQAVASRLPLPGKYSGGGIALVGSLVYVMSDNALQIVDVASAAVPRIVGSIAIGGSADDIVTGAGWAYLNIGGFQVAIVDVRDPSRPARVASIGWQWSCGAWSRDTLYGCTNGKIHVQDVASPGSPRYLGYFDYQTSAWDAAVVGNRAFFATSAGVGIVDVSNRAALVNVGTEASPTPLVHLEASQSGLLITIDESGTLTLYSAGTQ